MTQRICATKQKNNSKIWLEEGMGDVENYSGIRSLGSDFTSSAQMHSMGGWHQSRSPFVGGILIVLVKGCIQVCDKFRLNFFLIGQAYVL